MYLVSSASLAVVADAVNFSGMEPASSDSTGFLTA